MTTPQGSDGDATMRPTRAGTQAGTQGPTVQAIGGDRVRVEFDIEEVVSRLLSDKLGGRVRAPIPGCSGCGACSAQ